MSLRDMMARHAAGPLVSTNHLGEVVTFIDAEGEETEVTVTVNRLDVEPADGSPRVARLFANVFVARASLPVDPAPGQSFRLALRIGAAPVVARITRIIAQDDAALLLEVGA